MTSQISVMKGKGLCRCAIAKTAEQRSNTGFLPGVTMTRAEAIRSMNDVELSGFLCALTDSECNDCFFGSNSPQECAAERYLEENVKYVWELLVPKEKV